MKEQFNVTNEKAMFCRFHAQTGGSTLTAQQIDNNVVRTTIQALSAVLGGAQSLHTNSREEALSLPTDDSARLALRTQQIIAYESGLVDYPDPLGGSYVIETLTDSMETEANAIINEVENNGGAIAAIESGWTKNEIARSASEYQASIDKKDKIIVGINEFKTDGNDDYNTLSIDEKAVAFQLKRLQEFKSSRNNELVGKKLKILHKTAAGSSNLMPAIIECVRSRCTLGEISDQLRDVFGEYQSNFGYSVLMNDLNAWFAQSAGESAQKCGGGIVPGVHVNDISWDAEKERTTIQTDELDEFQVKAVIAADGVNSEIAQITNARPKFSATQLYQGVKAVVKLPENVINDTFAIGTDSGAAHLFAGDITLNHLGVGFLYTNRDTLSVGAVYHFDSLLDNPTKPNTLLDALLKNPMITELIKDEVPV